MNEGLQESSSSHSEAFNGTNIAKCELKDGVQVRLQPSGHREGALAMGKERPHMASADANSSDQQCKRSRRAPNSGSQDPPWLP